MERLQMPTSEWAKDPKYKTLGLWGRAAIEQDIGGTVGRMAHAIGWTKDEVAVWEAHLRTELRSLEVHAYYRARVVWAQKPVE